jgi:HEAT repeat protein/beta-lactamase regulating signal transducer with metallopeptidase domain
MRILDLASLPSGAALLPFVNATAKATILFATAGVLSILLRRRSAAVRHLVWTLALISALLLPLLSIALPRWQVGLFELPAPVGATAVGIERAAPAVKAGLKASATDTGSTAMADLEASTTDMATTTDAASTVRAGLKASATDTAGTVRISWAWALFVLWLIGASAILSRLALGLVAVQWMSRRTERVSAAPWLAQARALAADLGVSRITFLRSGRAAMPMACGMFRPAVLMPADADHWPAERLRIVLLHELAHVKRQDCLTHVLAQVACAAHWFNPLAWVAARHVRTERERACDDLVLASGTEGPDYADQLIEVARVMRAGRFPAVLAGASLAMAHRSQLEGRLMAILDPTVPRAGVSRVRTFLATVGFAVAVMPLASLQPWRVAAADAQVAAQAQPPAIPPTIAVPTQPAQPAQGERSVIAAQPDPVIVQSTRRQVARPVDADIPALSESIREGVTQGVVAGVHSGVAQGVSETIAAGVAAGIDSALAVTGAIQDAVIAGAAQRSASAQSKADPRTVAALTAALKDSDKEVRETALHALVQMRDPGIFDPLVQALSDPDPDVREQAAHGLGQLRDRRAIEPLTAAVKDQNADVREQAIFALGQFRDRATLPAMTAALKDTNADVRQQAVFAIGQLRDPSSTEALMSVLHDSNADVRQQAVFALGQIRDRRAVEPLISALKDSDADVREQAAFGLGQIRDRAAVEALVIALKDSVADVRQQAAFALGQLRDPRAIDGLTAALKDPSTDVRRQAAFALGQLAKQ